MHHVMDLSRILPGIGVVNLPIWFSCTYYYSTDTGLSFSEKHAPTSGLGVSGNDATLEG